MIKGLEATVLATTKQECWMEDHTRYNEGCSTSGGCKTITALGSLVPESPFYTLDSHLPTLMRMLIQKVCTDLLPWRVWYVALLGSCAVAEG